ncbi:MAG: diguanylate cyclase [Proteobacteria bacterium]|nr:diguanylate cyclase [Pseudomonadota bacterium]
MLFALLMVGAVLVERHAPAWHWIGPMLHLAVGSIVAWRLAGGAVEQRLRRRLRTFDHFCGGAWTALMAFSLLPSVLLFGILTLSNGVARLDRVGMVAYACGMAAGVALYGLHWQPEPDLVVLLACLPALLAQPFLVSSSSRVAIQHLRRRRDDLERQSRQDGLSGLYNRAHWESVLRNEFSHFRRTNEPAALVLADLDHFKRVNDDHGHAAGDEAIRRFAACLQRLLRATDLPGRYGGEEFGILLPHTTPEAARDVVERLRRDLHEHPLLDGAVVTASFGIAVLTPEVETHAAWLRLADQMLYRAKHLGRDRVAMLGDGGPAAHAPAPDPHHMQASAAVLATLRDPAVLPHLLSGLDMSESPLALFDANDRLVLANLAFLTLYGVGPGDHTFAEIMRGCWQRESGPRIETDDIEAWLRMALGKRRTRPRRSFAVDMLDGRWFWAIETTFSDGWVLVTLNDITDTMGVGAEGGRQSVRARLRDRRAFSARAGARPH